MLSKTRPLVVPSPGSGTDAVPLFLVHQKPACSCSSHSPARVKLEAPPLSKLRASDVGVQVVARDLHTTIDRQTYLCFLPL